MLYWTSSTICILRPLPSKIIYLTKKKPEGFYFSVISWYLRSPTYHTYLLLLLYYCSVYVHHTHLFSTRLSFQNPLHATKTCFACFALSQLCISSFACKLLCRQSTLIAKVNSCINCKFCITIIILHLSKIRGILKL